MKVKDIIQTDFKIENYRIQMSQQKNHFPRIDKSAMREITNSSKSKLASRLFRNSSLNHLNPNISMLSSSPNQASFLNTSASNSQLVASISLRKFKNKVENQAYLSICNGKVLVNSSHNSPKETKKQLFKKLDKLQHDSYSKILPDDLMDFTIEKQELNVLKLTKKASASSFKAKKTKNKFINGKEDLLPQDFIQMLEQDKNITNQFCYLKKMDHPYDLKIIQFDQNLEKKPDSETVEYPSQYITISSRGVTYFSQDQSRFVTLQEWKREANYFKKIIKLDFFKNFKIIKNFSNWKKCLRKSAMKSTIENLKEQLVYNDLYLSKSLLKIREICYSMETDVSYCRFDDCGKAADIKQFRASHEAFLDNEFRKKISRLQQNIKQVLINNMSLSMKEFKEENKISSSIEGKGMPLLIGDEKNLEMPYTKEATLRTQQHKFQKFVKLVDIIITHSKVNMMSESTNLIARKMEEENLFYDKQIVQSNYKNTFKGEQYLECVLTLDLKEQGLFLRPTKKDLLSLFEDVVSRSVVRICRYHKKISSDIDVLSIIYDNQDQFPKESQSQNLKAIMTSDNRQDQMINIIMEPISISYDYILRFIERFREEARIHFQNLDKLEQIQDFEPKDHETLKNYLQEWQKQKQFINNQIANEHEGPFFELSLRQFKQQIERSTDQCIRKAKIEIPKILQYFSGLLSEKLIKVKEQINQKPRGIEHIIELSQYLENIEDDIEDYKTQKGQIEALEKLMPNLAGSESNYRKSKSKIEEILNSLRQDVPEIKKTVQVHKNNAKKDVEEIKRNFKLSNIYDEIIKISEARSEPKTKKEMIVFIGNNRVQLTKMIEQFDKILTYEKFLNLAESDSMEINSFKQFFNVYEKIWVTLYDFEIFFTELSEKNYTSVPTAELDSKLEEFINVISSLIKEIKLNKERDSKFQFFERDQQALNSALEQAERVIRPLIDTIECLNNTVFGQKQLKQVRPYLESKNKQVLKLLEDKNLRLVRDLLTFSVPTQLPFLKAFALKAKNNSEVNKKFENVKNFTSFSKNHVNIFKNLTEKFKTYFGDFLREVDQKILMINFVIEQSENRDYEKAKQKSTLQKLRQILILWDQYEQHVQYFEPLITLTDCKNIQEIYKSFNQATEQNWKKTSKSCKDQNLNKILANERIIPSLKQSNQLLETLYPACKAYFYAKRLASPRLCFLSDSEIIKIQAECKDFKIMSNYIHLMYPSIKGLTFNEDQSVPNKAVNFDDESITIRIKVLGSEVQDFLRALEEALKTGVKTSLKQCAHSYDIETFNKSTWIKQNSLQALVFTTNYFFTSIIEQDYLSLNGDDLFKLYNYHLSQIAGLKEMIDEEKAFNSTVRKMVVLLTQEIGIRDTIYSLITNKVESKESYSWLKQVRSYMSYINNSEQAVNEYLNVPLSYGYEFVCMESNPLLLASFSDRTMIQLVNTIICCGNVPLVSKSLLPELANFNAKPYNYVCLASNEERAVLQHVVEGTWLTGAFTDVGFSSEVNLEQMEFMAKTLQQIQLAISLKEPTLRGFKNYTLNKEAGICLISPALIASPPLKECKVDYRVIQNREISWPAYMDLLFEVYQLQFANLGKKMARIICYLENSIPGLSFCRKEIKNFIEEVAIQKSSETAIGKQFLKKINKKNVTASEKKFISKVFQEAFGVHSNEKLLSFKSIRDINVSQQEINKLIAILKENKVCLVVGQSSQFKEHIAREVQKYFSDDASSSNFMVSNEDNLSDLFGYFRQAKWMDGTLNMKIRQSFSKRECFIIVGKCSKNIIFALEKLHEKSNGHINLENGDKLKLGSQQRIIFVSDSPSNEPLFKNCSLRLYDFDSIRYSPEEVLEYLTKRKIGKFSQMTFQNRYFGNKAESLALLQNIYLNNLEKIGNSSLKMIGYKSEYNEPNLIMNRFITVLNAVLTKDKDRSCTMHSKMMERLYIWGIFWAIGSSIPKRNIERLDKLFDSIKIDYDKSQSLSETEFAVSERNLTVSKFIKCQVECEDKGKNYFLVSSEMLAKKELIRLLVLENNHVMLIGDRNSGKSSYLEYLEQELQTENYSIIKTKINIKTTKEQFLAWLKPNIFIQYFTKNSECRHVMSSKNGKKLIIVVDNFNLIKADSTLFQFFATVTNYQYYNDELKNQKIVLGDICFICSTTGSFQGIGKENSFMLRQFFPMYINEPELSDVMAIYLKSLKKKLGNESKYDFMQKVLNSIVSLHTFAVNLASTQRQDSDQFLSYNTPIWIAKEVINRLCEQNCSVQEIISLWKYLTIKKYIDSGIVAKHSKMIHHELGNLVSLIVKKSDQSEQFLKGQIELVQELHKLQPLLRLKSDHSSYYTYLVYLLRSKQPKHMISHSNSIPPEMKAQALTSICESLELKFYHLRNADELNAIKKDQNTVVYVDERQRKTVEVALALIERNCRNGAISFVIDVENRNELMDYMRFYPTISKLAHIYDVQPPHSQSTQSIQDYKIIEDILLHSECHPESKQFTSFFWNVTQAASNQWEEINSRLTRKSALLENSVKNLKQLSKVIEESNTKLANLQKQMDLLNQHQEELLKKKGDTIQVMEDLKSKSKFNEANQKKQQLGLIEIQLKKIKTGKKDNSEDMAKIKQNREEKLEIYTLLQRVRLQQKCFEEHRVCNQLKKGFKLAYFKIINGFLHLYLKTGQGEKVLDYANLWAQENLGSSLAKVYSILLNIQISDVKSSDHVLKWIFSGFQTIFLTNYPQRLIEKLQAANPETKECNTSYQLSQSANKPVLTRDKELLNAGNHVSLICRRDLEGLDPEDTIVFEPRQQELNSYFQSTILNEVCKQVGEVEIMEIGPLNNQKRRFMVEDRLLREKLYGKICAEKPQPNFFSELKQISEAILALESRSTTGASRLQQIQSSVRQKYGSIVECASSMKQFLNEISKNYPYVTFNQSHLTEIVFSSLIFKQKEPEVQEAEGNSECNQSTETTKVIQIDLSIKKIERKICQWVCLSLSPIDSVFGYFLFACRQLRKQNTISKGQLEGIKKIMNEETKEIRVKSHEALKQVLTLIIESSQNRLQQMLQFSERVLGLDHPKMLESKQEWIQSIFNIFDHRIAQPEHQTKELKKIFMIGRDLGYNAYKIVNKEIRKHFSNEQNILFFQATEPVQGRIELLEKLNVSQQSWVILDGWTDPSKINRMVEYIGKSKFYRAVFLFQGKEKLRQIKMKLNTSEYYQVYLHDRTKNICYETQRILKKYELPSASPEVAKILKMMAGDHISRLAKGLVNPAHKSTAYTYRLFESMMSKITNLDVFSVIRFAIDFFYDPANQSDRGFLKEANKIFKAAYISKEDKSLKPNEVPQICSEIYDDNSTCEYYSQFLEGLQALKLKIDKEGKLKRFLNSILLQNISTQIPTDLLFGFSQCISKPIPNQKRIPIENKTKTLQNLNFILQKAPILIKQEQSDKGCAFYIEILKQEKRALELAYTEKLEKVRKMAKILESRKHMMRTTEHDIAEINAEKDSFLETLLQIYWKITLIQRRIESKQQLSLHSCLPLVSRPQYFLHVFMFESQNLSKVDWTQFGLQARCINDKEKQLLKESIEKNQYLQLQNLKINNAKFESHKYFIESLAKGQSSKLCNVFIYIGKEQSQPFSRHVPFKIDDSKVAQIAFTSKTKELGFWSPQIFVSLGQSEPQRQETKKK